MRSIKVGPYKFPFALVAAMIVATNFMAISPFVQGGGRDLHLNR